MRRDIDLLATLVGGNYSAAEYATGQSDWNSGTLTARESLTPTRQVPHYSIPVFVNARLLEGGEGITLAATFCFVRLKTLTGVCQTISERVLKFGTSREWCSTARFNDFDIFCNTLSRLEYTDYEAAPNLLSWDSSSETIVGGFCSGFAGV